MATLGTIRFGVQADIGRAVSNLNQFGRTVRESTGHMPAGTNAAGNFSRSLTQVEHHVRRGTVAFAGIARQAVSFAAGNILFTAVGKAFDALKNAFIGTSSALETTTLQFKSLGLSGVEAKAHVQSLFAFAKATPFETEPIIMASRQLHVFGGAALDTR